jgi:hypothetical protein
MKKAKKRKSAAKKTAKKRKSTTKKAAKSVKRKRSPASTTKGSGKKAPAKGSGKKAPVTKQPQDKQKAAAAQHMFLYTDDAWSLQYFDQNDLHFKEREVFG